jgi:hypothetical protein
MLTPYWSGKGFVYCLGKSLMVKARMTGEKNAAQK